MFFMPSHPVPISAQMDPIRVCKFQSFSKIEKLQGLQCPYKHPADFSAVGVQASYIAPTRGLQLCTRNPTATPTVGPMVGNQ